MSSAIVYITIAVVVTGAVVVFFYWRSQYGAWQDTPGGLRGGRHDRARGQRANGGNDGTVTVVPWTTVSDHRQPHARAHKDKSEHEADAYDGAGGADAFDAGSAGEDSGGSSDGGGGGSD